MLISENMSNISYICQEKRNLADFHMRISLRWLHAWPVPEQLAIGKVKEAFDDDGNLIHDDIKERLENLVKSVLNTTKKFSE